MIGKDASGLCPQFYRLDKIAPSLSNTRTMHRLLTATFVGLLIPVATALERAGAHSHALYDGSWSEWGAAADVPIETG